MYDYLESTNIDNLMRIVNEAKELKPSLRLIQVFDDGDRYLAFYEEKERVM